MTRAGDSGPLDWRRLEAVWDAVRGLPPDERDAFFVSQALDGALRDELESLLHRASTAEGFFEQLSAVVPRSGEAMPDEGLDPDGPAGGSDASAGAYTDPLIGTTLAHYEIVGRLGQGGMGIVYRANDIRLRRTVALKLLRPRAADDLRAKDRLLVEARAAAALDHPNICTIYEVGETSERSAFIAMAFYLGETLEQILRRGPLPLATSLDYTTQIARGLGAAHDRGIIHRDVKPANVIVTSDGVAKLLDFGIARSPDVEISREGVTPGTIAYMSPEQVASRPLDQRTDLWSLGVVLYEMCTGERPFRADSAGAVLYAILDQSPTPASTIRGEVPTDIDSIIARLLAKAPERRYGNAEELISDLSGISETRQPAGRDTRPGANLITRASETDQDDATATLEPSSGPRRRRVRRAAWYGALALAAAIWPVVVELTQTGEPRPVATALSTAVPANRTQDSPLSARRLAAKDLHEQGMQDVLFRTDSGRRRSSDFFRQAIAADSTYAPAHASLALVRIAPGEHRRATVEDAEQSARTAIRLDSLHPVGHAALGRVLMFNYRFAEAETHLKRAVEIDPKTPLREFLISLYQVTDRPRDMLAEAKEFVANDPTSSIAIAERANGYLMNGRCSEALAELDRLGHMRPPRARAGNIAAQCHAVRKEWPQAIATMRRVADTNEQARGYLGFMLARGGERDSARAIRDTLLARHQRGVGTAWGLVVVHAGLGDLDAAFRWLESSYEDRSLRGDIMGPLFADLQRDPRFELLRRRLGIRK